MSEEQERADRIRGYKEKAEKKPLVRRGWVCDHPDVKKVWFVGYLIDKEKSICGIRLEMIFNNNARYSIDGREVANLEGDLEELLALKADEYLRNGGTGTLSNLIIPDQSLPKE